MFSCKAILKTSISFIICVVLVAAQPLASRSYAQMIAIDDEGLSGISAQSGISINIGDSGARYTADVIKYSDTDHTPPNWIEFRNYVIDDGSGGYFSFDTEGSNPACYNFITIDVGTGVATAGQTTIVVTDTSHYNPRYYSVGTVVFCNQALGSLDIDNVTRQDSNFTIASHADGTYGIDFDYKTKMYIGEFKFTYNTAGSALSFSDIHLVEDATVITGDTPEDPTTWDLSDIRVVGKFKVGDLENGNPATIDVATVSSVNKTSVFYNFPMEGCIRVEDVTFGARDFGPCAIDGIDVHHLNIQMEP